MIAGTPQRIVDVWADNLLEQIAVISEVLEEYPYIAVDTEFPGIVARPIGSFKNANEYHYQTLKCNVDLLKIIQIGLSFLDVNGELKEGVCTWQFNFDFDLNGDMYAQDSIDLLRNAGINFKETPARGIDVHMFGEVLLTSGLVLNDEVRWISFHGGYDFAYLTKVLSCLPLATKESEFFELLHAYFPYLYDVKYLMKNCDSVKGGLNSLAQQLGIKRIGPQHQAGSDSMLTGNVFFKLRQKFFEGEINDEKFSGILYGLGQDSDAKPSSRRF
uniref:poly(A)-specific ribonuclease n=3 Tax=Hirondellea gigas TaxID=1518452 RepID=A0A6A7G872_9CRUS